MKIKRMGLSDLVLCMILSTVACDSSGRTTTNTFTYRKKVELHLYTADGGEQIHQSRLDVFESTGSILPESYGFPTEMFAYDFDGDSFDELLILTEAGYLRIFETMAGVFTNIDLGIRESPLGNSFIVGDVNSDGHTDLLINGLDDNLVPTLVTLLGDGTLAGLASAAPVTTPLVDENKILFDQAAWGYNAAGDYVLLVIDGTSVVEYTVNEQGEAVVNITVELSDSVEDCISVYPKYRFADLDDDGKTDILAFCPAFDGGDALAFTYDAAGNETAIDLSSVEISGEPNIYDYDGDGVTEILFKQEDSSQYGYGPVTLSNLDEEVFVLRDIAYPYRPLAGSDPVESFFIEDGSKLHYRVSNIIDSPDRTRLYECEQADCVTIAEYENNSEYVYFFINAQRLVMGGFDIYATILTKETAAAFDF